MDVSGQTVRLGHFTATEIAEDFIDLDAGWALELVWIFWRRKNSIASAKICTPDIPAYILVIILNVMPHTDLKIIQMSVLMKWDGWFVLVELVL
jgi:hypothetical protein